jgi:hypothetical protein
MLTDAEARDLLHTAADTIAVGPAAPLPVVHRPTIWPMLVAAAAVIAVVLGTLALADRGSSPTPSNVPPPTLSLDRIPPVMGLDPLDAQELLEASGLVVRVQNQPGCVSPRVAAGTSPPVGSTFTRGDEVELTVVDSSMDFCDSTVSQAWGLLRFALQVAQAPHFADTVTLYPGRGEPVVLTAAEARDPANWNVCAGDLCGSALSILASAATRPGPAGTAAPILEMREQPRSFNRADPCMNGADIGGNSTHYGISIGPPMDGIAICPQVTVQYTRTGLLEAVAIPLFPTEEEPSAPATPAAATAEAFVAWARGSGQPPAFAGDVRYLVNDAVVRRWRERTRRARAAGGSATQVCRSAARLRSRRSSTTRGGSCRAPPVRPSAWPALASCPATSSPSSW